METSPAVAAARHIDFKNRRRVTVRVIIKGIGKPLKPISRFHPSSRTFDPLVRENQAPARRAHATILIGNSTNEGNKAKTRNEHGAEFISCQTGRQPPNPKLSRSRTFWSKNQNHDAAPEQREELENFASMSVPSASKVTLRGLKPSITRAPVNQLRAPGGRQPLPDDYNQQWCITSVVDPRSGHVTDAASHPFSSAAEWL